MIGADTIVSYNNEILGKPVDESDAFKTLKMLQGNIHQVYTGVTVLIKKNGKWEDISFSESTDVSFYPVSDEEIRTYIASGEPMDKAGSYGIQGRIWHLGERNPGRVYERSGIAGWQTFL